MSKKQDKLIKAALRKFKESYEDIAGLLKEMERDYLQCDENVERASASVREINSDGSMSPILADSSLVIEDGVPEVREYVSFAYLSL